MDSPALDAVLQNNQLAKDGGQLKFSEARVTMNSMNWFDAAVFAEARSMVDWNARNKVLHQFHAWKDRVLISPHQFCSSCGSPLYSLWAGWKLACTTLLPWKAKAGEEPCASSVGLNNFSHPRTDPVIITVPINEAGDKILLGRNVSGLEVLKVALFIYTRFSGEMEFTCLFCSRGFHGTR